MYARVLVALDGSELAEAILPFAEQVAGPLDAEVVVLRVVEPTRRAASRVPARRTRSRRHLDRRRAGRCGYGARLRTKCQITATRTNPKAPSSRATPNPTRTHVVACLRRSICLPGSVFRRHDHESDPEKQRSLRAATDMPSAPDPPATWVSAPAGSGWGQSAPGGTPPPHPGWVNQPS
jgi:hypothetical protein